MACMKLGSKADGFQRKGQAWFCTTGLPSDVVVEVGEMSFHLHKFPLLSRSGVMERLIAEASEEGEDGCCVIQLHDVPGGAQTFELVAKFCYGVKLELTSANVVHLNCASEHLVMSEEYGEGNLISTTETFLSQVVLRSWRDSLRALQSCDAGQPHIAKRCIESLAAKAGTDPNLFGWPVTELGGPMQSPGGSVLWNGISTGARPKTSSSDWWYEDASTLSLVHYKQLVSAMEARGVSQKVIAGSLCYYAKKHLPGLNRRQMSCEPISCHGRVSSEEEQRVLLEEMERLLPMEKDMVPPKFLFGLLRTAMILRADPTCVSNLEKRVGMELDEATLEDLLMPTFSHSMETLYNVDCVQRVLEHFLAMDQEGAAAGEESPPPCSAAGDDGQVVGPTSLTPITTVAKLIDGYLAEVAPDVNLKLPKFQSLAAAVPEYARPLDDGLYRAIDIYLKSHPWLPESDRENLCRLMDCQKLSLEACTHAAQNERLPLRIIVQVLFFEQLQLRTSIAGCFLVSSENLQDRGGGGGAVVGPTAAAAGEGGCWATAVRENQVLKVGMDSMRLRVSELERECSLMRQEIEKLGRGTAKAAAGPTTGGAWAHVTRKLGFKLKSSSQMCRAQEGSVSNQNISTEAVKTDNAKGKTRAKHQKNVFIDQ